MYSLLLLFVIMYCVNGKWDDEKCVNWLKNEVYYSPFYLSKLFFLYNINHIQYSDYNEKTSMKGLGFKNKDKALYTISAIKHKPIKYQVNVVSTMLGRAKNHPHINDDMREAIKVFQNWLNKYNNNK